MNTRTELFIFSHRINGVFKDIQAGVPFLSDSEKKMKEELEKIQEYMKFMKSSLQEVSC